MIRTRSVGLSAARASSAGSRARAADSTSARLSRSRRSAASWTAPATSSASTLLVHFRRDPAATYAAPGLRQTPPCDGAEHEEYGRSDHEPWHVPPERESSDRECDQHDDDGGPGGG